MNKNFRALGFSLVELMVVLGLIAGVALVVMNLTKQSSKSSAKFQFDSDIGFTTNEINALLSDPAKCLSSLGNTANPTNIANKYYISTNPLAPTGGYGDSGFKIIGYSFAGAAPDGVLTVTYQNKKILAGATGPSSIAKKINVYFEGLPGAITNCRSLATSSTDIWTHGTGSDIYYSGGKVGIGTSTPSYALDVNGAIRTSVVSNNTGSIDFSTGNLQYTSASCGVMTLVNMKSGGVFTLIVQGPAGGDCSFSAYGLNGTGALTVKTGSINLTQTANKHIIFTFMVTGSNVYVASIDGY